MTGFLGFLMACAGSEPDGKPTTLGSESDTDTDTDTDTDLTVDTADSAGETDTTDTDTGTPAPSLVTGEWIGSCIPIEASGTFSRYDMDLRLVETGGAVTGKGVLSSISEAIFGSTGGGGSSTNELPVVIRGTFDGVSEIELDLDIDYGPAGTFDLGRGIDGTISGTSWTGSMFSTETASHYPTFDCSYERK